MGYEVRDRQVIYDGKKVRLEVHHLKDEHLNKQMSREVVVHPGAVVVLPFLAEDRVVLIKNKRYAVHQTLIELPAGTLEKGENPLNCAGRELLEETGYLAGRLKILGNFYTSPGILSEKMYAFAAYDLEEKKTAHEEGEEIELLTATLDQAFEMIRLGQIADGKTIATLLMYDRFHRRAQ
ncbi:MAG TPA: NUDIX hydrolase [Tepidisphaeraceae bacterium]|nr:NUDIX hydrolase [Tepidisphaeraceae bacterium]